MSEAGFGDRLDAAIRAAGSPVCVGIDPVLESLPAEVRARHHQPTRAIDEFVHAVIDQAAGIAPAVKFQSACFERYGSGGLASLESAVAHARSRGVIVIWDCKRGDIATTGAHYAAAAIRLGAHAVTASPYMGDSALLPFLEAGLGVFSLVRTSNPDSDALQAMPLHDGRTVAQMVADRVASLGGRFRSPGGMSALGAVVGATKAGEAASLRARMPDQFFLVPGYGAQGGTARDVEAMLRPDGRGVLVTASRSILYPRSDAPWPEAIRAATAEFAREIGAIVRARASTPAT